MSRLAYNLREWEGGDTYASKFQMRPPLANLQSGRLKTEKPRGKTWKTISVSGRKSNIRKENLFMFPPINNVFDFSEN